MQRRAAPARRLWAAVAAGVFGVVLALALGNWQTQRAADKLAADARWQAAEAMAPRPLASADLARVAGDLPLKVRLHGRFLHEKSVWLDNRPLDGRAGLLLLTPLLLADSASSADAGATVVLVLRGWVPRNAQDRNQLAPVERPAGPVQIDGLALPNPPRVYALGDGAEPTPLPAIWQNLDFEQYERAAGLRVVPWVVQQHGGAADGLLRQWPRPGSGAEKHRGYALQWYSLAALFGLLTLILGARALLRRSEPQPPP